MVQAFKAEVTDVSFFVDPLESQDDREKQLFEDLRDFQRRFYPTVLMLIQDKRNESLDKLTKVRDLKIKLKLQMVIKGDSLVGFIRSCFRDDSSYQVLFTAEDA